MAVSINTLKWACCFDRVAVLQKVRSSNLTHQKRYSDIRDSESSSRQLERIIADRNEGM